MKSLFKDAEIPRNHYFIFFASVCKFSWWLWRPRDPTRCPEVRRPVLQGWKVDLPVSDRSGSARVGWKILSGAPGMERIKTTLPWCLKFSFLSIISQDINSLITKKEKKIEHHDSKLTMCCFVTGPNTFDSPSAVAAAMTGSLAGLMDVLSPDDKKKGGYHEMLSTCWYNWNTHNQ